MLNGGGSNARSVNGSFRLPVYASALALATVAAAFTPDVEVRGDGQAVTRVAAAFSPSAIRKTTCDLGPVVLNTDLAETVYRLGDGAFPIVTEAVLDFVSYKDLDGTLTTTLGAELTARCQGYFGDAPLDLALALDPFAPVAYRLGDGAGTLTVTTDLDADVFVRGEADVVSGFFVDPLAPIAYRIPASDGFALSLSASLDGVRRKTPDTQSVLNFYGEADGLIYRVGYATPKITLSTDLDETITRVGIGDSIPLSYVAQLFTSQAREGAGTAVFTLLAEANIGVQFGQADVVFTPAEAALTGTRSRVPEQATATITYAGDLSASAYRSPVTEVDTIVTVGGQLDPAVTSGGVQYITAGMDATVALDTEGGFARQLAFGGLDGLDVTLEVEVTASRVRQPAFDGAPIGVYTENLGKRYTFIDGAATTVLVADGWGQVTSFGAGDAVAQFGAAIALTAQRYLSADDIVSTLNGSGTGYITHLLASELPLLELTAEGTGLHYARLYGDAVLSVASDSEVAPNVWKFFNGEPVVTTITAEGTGEVYVQGDGVAPVALESSLTPLRYAHADGQGIISVTAALDGGVYVESTGEAAILDVQGELDGLAIRTLVGPAQIIQVRGGLTGNVLAPGEGDISIALAATQKGYLIKQISNVGTIALDPFTASLTPIRWLMRLPLVNVQLAGDLAATRTHLLQGDAIMDVLGSSESYINITDLDIDTQIFPRPATRKDWDRTHTAKHFERVKV